MELSEVDILREICVLNGIDFYDDSNEVFDIKSLQIFFISFPRFISFKQFPSLCKIVIISQDVSEISCLDSCPNLKTLWICECQIKCIRNLEPCRNLQELNLYGNTVEKMENLSCLTNLRTLNLADNDICVIEGISELKQLNVLDLSGNRIIWIGNSLLENQNLQTLSLSGNDIHHISEIIHLSAISKLTYLNLNITGYPKNPICNNSNFIILILYYMPQLKQLDDCDVSPCDFQHAIQCVVSAKQSYYMMKQQSSLSIFNNKLQKLEIDFQKTFQDYIKHIGFLHKSVKLLENSKARKNYSAHEQIQLSNWINRVQSRLKTWVDAFDHINSEHHSSVEGQKRSMLLKKTLYQLELEMWGDFKFTEIAADDLLFQKCSNLLRSRLCMDESNSSNIISLRIHHVYKLFNRLLELKFLDTIKCTSDSGSICSSSSELQSAEYLEETAEVKYLIVPSIYSKEMLSLVNHLKFGFDGYCNNIQLYTYLNDANRELLENIKIIRSPGNAVVYSSLILVKSSYFEKEENGEDVFKDGRPNCLYVPEYIVELEYVFKTVKPFSLIENVIDSSKQNKMLSFSEEKQKDEVFLKKIPERFFKHMTRELNETSLEVYCEQKLRGMENAMHVSLLDVRFPANISLQKFKSLTHLYINHCSLSCPPNISCLPLSVVDLSHNLLVTVNTLKDLQKLIVLDLSFNNLCDLHEVVMVINGACQNIYELNIRANPWKYRETVHHFVAKNIETLMVLDGFHTNKMNLMDENVLKMASMDLQFIKQTSFSTDLDICGTPFTTIYATAEYMSIWRKLPKPNDNISWGNISIVCLKRSNLRKLENMERLINLQFICLNENYLTSLTGILECSNLKEISAENNFISSFDDFSKLTKLKRLLLANNFIRHVNVSICGGSSLEVLSIHSNKIQTLGGVEQYSYLNELYAGNNSITEFESILLLKSFNTLLILDLSQNPVTLACRNYRLRVIFHLKTLKALDGEPIANTEIIYAREQFGGHLSLDFLMDHLEQTNFHQLTSLDLANCGLKYIDFMDPVSAPCLRSINLEKNLLTSFGGLVLMTQIEILCLNENNITCLFSKMAGVCENMNNSIYERFASLYRSKCPLFPKLKVLHLSRNQLSSLQPLLLHRMPSIRCLFLQHNDISSLRELEDLKQLKELVLDCNKLKELHDVPALCSLIELHLENNRLREIFPLSTFKNLLRLYVGGNKLNDPTDLEKFSCSHTQLLEISLIDNPIQYKRLHRLILAHNMPKLQIIDGVQVTSEEREHANAFYNEQDLQLYFNSNVTSQYTQANLHNARACLTLNELSLTGVKTQKTLLPAAKVNIVNAVSQYIAGSAPSVQDEDKIRCMMQSGTASAKRRDKQANSPLLTFSFQTKPNGFCETNKEKAFYCQRTDDYLPGMTVQPALSPQLHGGKNILATQKEFIVRKQNRS